MVNWIAARVTVATLAAGDYQTLVRKGPIDDDHVENRAELWSDTGHNFIGGGGDGRLRVHDEIEGIVRKEAPRSSAVSPGSQIEQTKIRIQFLPHVKTSVESRTGARNHVP